MGIPLPATKLSRPTSAPARGERAPPSCTAPCLARARVGVYVPQRTLTHAERDSVLQALSAAIPLAANAAGSGSGSASGTGGTAIAPPRPGGLTPLGGVSIPIGLPGGGPSRAQRKRDSTVNAHVLPILKRLRVRADSVLAARRRDDSLEAIAKQRRDSVAGAAQQRSDSTSTKPMSQPK